jgi:flagellar motor switch protein FliM
MADLLSQDEIDALLAAIDEGASEIPETLSPKLASAEISNPVPYAFPHSEIFSKEQLYRLQKVHKTFCHALSGTLSSYLRTFVDLTLVTVESEIYAAFIQAIPHNPACMYVFSMKPLEGHSALEIDPLLVHAILDRLLGGRGASSLENKALTDIEHAVFTKVRNFFFKELQEAWKPIVECTLECEQFESNPPFVQMVSPEEPVILVTCTIKMDALSGIVRIAFPYVSMRRILPSLSTPSRQFFTQETQNQKQALQTNIEATKIPVTAVLGTTQISIRALLGLKVGDTLILKQKMTDPTTVYFDNKAKFLGLAGNAGKERAVLLKCPLTDSQSHS